MLKQLVATGTALGMLVVGLAGTLVLPSPASAVLLQGEATAGPDLGIEYPAASGLRKTDVRITIAKIIRAAMGLLGIVALVIILIGGYTWMTAGGNDEKVEEAKKWISAGVIGLAIILSAFSIAYFVVNSLVNATTSGDATSI